MIHKILKKYWGYDSFRPMQKEIIESVMSGNDTLGILPTGGGKSVTFQVPGMAFPGIVIVVTPLISLMKDQVENLRKRGLKAVSLNSGMTFRERNLARERLFNDKTKFLYISPERLGLDSFLTEIRRLKVSLIVIDEAHCISQWGYDFRPSYLKLKKLRKIFPSVPILALTASATKEVAEDICKQLEFTKDSAVFRSGITRENLSFVVRPSEGKMFDIHRILESVPGSAIIYVRSRKRTREIAEYLCNSSISASFYHAGLDSFLKAERQTKWKDGEIRVMVATNAFGMGIDKADVRVVIHYDMPPSLEEYYQEAGRAGRDGLRAYAVLLTAKSDKGVLRRRLTMEFPDKGIIRRIYTRLCVFSHLEIGEGFDYIKEFDLIKFCRTYGQEEAVVRPSLRILGQAGYVEFIEEFENSSRIMVTVDRDELYRVRLASPVHEKILTSILRNYPGLFTDYVFVNEKKIAYLTQLDVSVVYEKLVEMSKEKIIHYIPRRKTQLLHFLTSMEEEKYVSIGKDIYEFRKEILRQRIEAMIDYAFSPESCRVKKMKSYFGEEDESECGHCDICHERKKKERSPVKESEIRAHLQKIFAMRPSGYTDDELARIFGSAYDKAIRLLRNLHRDGEIRYENGLWSMK